MFNYYNLSFYRFDNISEIFRKSNIERTTIIQSALNMSELIEIKSTNMSTELLEDMY